MLNITINGTRYALESMEPCGPHFARQGYTHNLIVARSGRMAAIAVAAANGEITAASKPVYAPTPPLRPTPQGATT